MQTRVSLSKKVLLFLAVLLGLQLIFISALVYLQITAEEQTRKATRATRMASLVSSLGSEIFTMVACFQDGSALLSGGKSELTMNRSVVRGAAAFEKLKKLTNDNPHEHEQVLEAEKTMAKAVKVLAALKEDYSQTGEAGELGRLKLWGQIRRISSYELFKRLNDLSAEETEIVAQDPIKQAANRAQLRTWLYASLAVTLISILALAKYLVGNITARLSVMHDNAYRLASNLPLNKTLPGNDEIAVLDRTFHNMAELLQEAAAKERAIVDNAKDVICSFDGEGRFVSVNAAVENLLGLSPGDLIGKQMIDLIAEEDLSSALQYFNSLQSAKTVRPLEIRMHNASGDLVDTLWSAFWSEKENSLFCVIHDMTERNLAERLKEEVMAMVNHDLRTPLTTVQVSLELLRKNEGAKMSHRGMQLLDNMTNSCNQVLRLTQDLLDMDRLESGRLELDLEACDISQIIERASEVASGIALKQNIRLQTALESLIVEADNFRLEQVVVNILTNALKFSPVGSTVTITARPSNEGGFARVSISDQGPGIPANMKDQVFERYKQVKSNKSAKKKGSGLGLAICKGLIEQHQGSIWVESNAGQGATFVFTVPLKY